LRLAKTAFEVAVKENTGRVIANIPDESVSLLGVSLGHFVGEKSVEAVSHDLPCGASEDLFVVEVNRVVAIYTSACGGGKGFGLARLRPLVVTFGLMTMLLDKDVVDKEGKSARKAAEADRTTEQGFVGVNGSLLQGARNLPMRLSLWALRNPQGEL
jgi:hypothetical protein